MNFESTLPNSLGRKLKKMQIVQLRLQLSPQPFKASVWQQCQMFLQVQTPELALGGAVTIQTRYSLALDSSKLSHQYTNWMLPWLLVWNMDRKHKHKLHQSLLCLFNVKENHPNDKFRIQGHSWWDEVFMPDMVFDIMYVMYWQKLPNNFISPTN